MQVPSYAAAKHGLLGMTRALANEWATDRIRVNAIAPGYMETELTAAHREDPANARRACCDRIPIGPTGEPPPTSPGPPCTSPLTRPPTSPAPPCQRRRRLAVPMTRPQPDKPFGDVLGRRVAPR